MKKTHDSNTRFAQLVLLTSLVSLLTATSGAGQEYATWTRAGNSGTGSFVGPVPLPNFSWQLTGDVRSVAVSNMETWTGTVGIEAVYGEADNESNLNIRVEGNSGPIGSPIDAQNTLVLTFNSATPDSGWAFALIDMDVDQALISAIDSGGSPVPVAQIDTWLEGFFDADPVTDGINLPTWDTTTDPNLAVLVGASDADGLYDTIVEGGTPDTETGGAWFSPNVALQSLTIIFQNQKTGTPSYHVYVASEEAQPELAISKDSMPAGVVAAGDTITYTIVVDNVGPGAATDVVVTDALPPGVQYVAGTAEKTYWTDQTSSGSFSRDLGSATFDTPGLTQSFDTTGSIPAGATLTSYGLTTTGTSNDWLSDITLVATYPSGTAYSIGLGGFGGNGSGNWNVARGPGAFGGPAEGSYSFVWDDRFNGVGGNDNAITTAVFNIEYDVNERLQLTDAAGAPPNLVTAADGVRLEPGESMTVTFDVVVDDPLDLSILEITNEAEALAAEITMPVMDDVTNPTEFGVPVTLARFEATDLGGGSDARTVRFDWLTSTEVGNLGFHLYALRNGTVERVNDELIASSVIDSVQPQAYSFEADGIRGERFFLVDVDIRGTRRFHGPFELNRPVGSSVTEAKRTDWKKIRSARRAARRERKDAQPSLGGARLNRLRANRLGGSFPSATIRVDVDGVQRIRYEDLLAAGIDLTGAPLASLAVINEGLPVPIRVRGTEAFGPGAYVEFLGEALNTLYTRTNIYRLKVDRDSARRIPTHRTMVSPQTPVEPYYIESTLVEQDHLYSFGAPGDDPWHDRSLLAISGPVSTELAIELDEWVVGASPVELAIELWGGTDFPLSPDHHVVAEVNGVEIADEFLDGLEARIIDVTIDDSILQAGGNTLTLRLPHDTGAQFDLVQYDRYRINYPRHFKARDGALTFTASGAAFRVDGLSSRRIAVYREREIDGERRVQRLRRRVAGTPGDYSATFVGSETPTTYHVVEIEAIHLPAVEPEPAVIDAPSGDAELLIVAHTDFVEALDRFAEFKRSQGVSVLVADIETVYRQFNHGILDPAAIHALVRFAHRELDTESLLLVGGDTYDYHDHLGLGALSFVPTPYTATDEIIRFAPVDPLYGDIDGDSVPDLAVGRWPVRTIDELNAVIDKTLAYTGEGRHAVFAADGADPMSGYSFAEASDDLATMLPIGWSLERAYVDDLGVEGASEVLMAEMNAGASLASYFGHSGPTVWSFQGLFDTTDAAVLANESPMIVTQWGCWNTYYVAPEYDTLGHELLLGPTDGAGVGAAAVLGAATLTNVESERLRGQLMFEEFATPGITLGEAIRNAKRRLADTDPNRLDVLLGWTLLGDPTLVLWQ